MFIYLFQAGCCKIVDPATVTMYEELPGSRLVTTMFAMRETGEMENFSKCRAGFARCRRLRQ